MCVGGGLDEAANEPVAKLVQQRLRDSDFSKLSAEQGLECLLRLLSNREECAESQAVTPLLKRGTRVELAIIDSDRQQMIRKHLRATPLNPNSKRITKGSKI